MIGDLDNEKQVLKVLVNKVKDVGTWLDVDEQGRKIMNIAMDAQDVLKAMQKADRKWMQFLST